MSSQLTCNICCITPFGHIAWDAPMLFENTKQRVSSYHGYPPGTEKILVFDRYDDISAKDHERIRRRGEGTTNYNLTITAHYQVETPFSRINTTSWSCHAYSPPLTWMQTCQLTVAIMVDSSMTRQV